MIKQGLKPRVKGIVEARHRKNGFQKWRHRVSGFAQPRERSSIAGREAKARIFASPDFWAMSRPSRNGT
ncbi:hypothetical protein VTG60DRAFT_2031 [Thermothelomyces hinnuleus]